MTASEYKAYKNIRKENLMSRIEVLLTDLGELTTHDIAEEKQQKGLKENVKAAKRGGKVAKGARDLYEKETKKSVISKNNILGYNYIEENEQIENKYKEKL